MNNNGGIHRSPGSDAEHEEGANKGQRKRDDGELDTQLQLEKYEQDRQQQEVEGRTMPITISDEERPTGETTKDTGEPREALTENEPPVTTNEETTAISEEQLPTEAGIITDVAAK